MLLPKVLGAVYIHPCTTDTSLCSYPLVNLQYQYHVYLLSHPLGFLQISSYLKSST